MSSIVINNPIDKFKSLVMRGVEAWIEAGKLVSQQLDSDPEWAEKVHAKHPEISEDTVYCFDRVGRMQLHPRLLISDAPGHKRLRQLPYDLQQKYLDGPVEVLVPNGGKWDTLKIDSANLTPAQASQVFGQNAVRTIAAQRAFIEDQAAKKMVPSTSAGEPFRIVGKSLIIMEPCKLSARDIAKILSDMER